MAGDRATNIRINIDIKNAIAKLDTVSNKMRNMGQHAGSAGTAVQSNMNKATMAIKKTGDQSAASAVQFSTMANGMLNLSTSAVQTFTSISNLARAENRAKATAVSLERAEDLLARKQLQLNKIVEAGGKGGRDYALILGEIETAENDLAVKTDKLKIEQEAVTDVYMLFFANIANVGVSTMMIMATMLSNETKAKITSALVTKKNIVVNKLHALSNWNTSKSLVGSTAAVHAKTGALRISTIATKQATIATKLLTFALGPVGLIIIGISAALVAYETNFMGFKDSINGFLGIQTEFNETTEDGTDKINEQTEAINAQATAFDKLTIPMQNYITMQEKMARQNADPRELIRLAKFRGSQGFSSGVGSPSGGTGTGGYSGGSGGSSSGVGSGSRATNNKVQQGKPAVTSAGGSGDPFGSIDEKVAFYSQSYAEQRDTLLSWIDNTWDNGLIQSEYISKYWEIFDLSNGFKDVKHEAQKPVDNLKNVLTQGATFLNASGNMKSVWAAGYGGDGNIFDFKLPPREMIKKALNVDIGEIANVVNVTDAIRIGTLQKMSKSYQGIGGRSTELLRQFDNAARASGWTGGSTGATAAYQTARGPGISKEAQRENAFNDMMANTGLGNRIKAAGNVFGVTQKLGIGYRSAIAAPAHWAKYATVTAMAREFGADDIAKQEMITAKAQLDKNMNSGRPGGIVHFINAYYEQTQKIAARSNARAAAKASAIGIDFNPNANEGTWEKRVAPGSKGVLRWYWNKSSLSSEAQIRADIQASSSVTLPSVSRIIAISESFSANGNYTNFNNTAITQDAMAKLGMTEQSVFDLRFQSTRGDRELENRMRHIEQQAASSSGTSPL